MDSWNSTVKGFDDSVNSLMAYVDKNSYVSSALAIFLIVYAGVAAPKLPKYIAKIFEYPLVQLVIFFLIAYIARKNATVAIIAAIGLMVTLITLNKISVNEKIQRMMMREGMDGGYYPQEGNPMPQMGPSSGLDEQVRLEEGSMRGVAQIPAESLSMMQQPPVYGCTKTANYRNSFYPQYVNMKPEAYMARYTGMDVIGVSDIAGH